MPGAVLVWGNCERAITSYGKSTASPCGVRPFCHLHVEEFLLPVNWQKCTEEERLWTII